MDEKLKCLRYQLESLRLLNDALDIKSGCEKVPVANLAQLPDSIEESRSFMPLEYLHIPVEDVCASMELLRDENLRHSFPVRRVASELVTWSLPNFVSRYTSPDSATVDCGVSSLSNWESASDQQSIDGMACFEMKTMRRGDKLVHDKIEPACLNILVYIEFRKTVKETRFEMESHEEKNRSLMCRERLKLSCSLLKLQSSRRTIGDLSPVSYNYTGIQKNKSEVSLGNKKIILTAINLVCMPGNLYRQSRNVLVDCINRQSDVSNFIRGFLFSDNQIRHLTEPTVVSEGAVYV